MRDATIELRLLRDKIDEQQEEIRQLKELLAPVTRFPWKMRPGSQRLLESLLASPDGTRTNEALLVAYKGLGSTADLNVIKVEMSHLRKSLPAGVVIETIWGSGYRLVPEGKRIIKQMLAEAA